MKRMALVIAVIAVCLYVFSPAFAEPWTVSVDANITLTQNAYSDNWEGGESGMMSWTFFSNSLAEKQLTPKLHNRNTLKLQFGQNHFQDEDTKDWGKPEKSNDLIDLESVFRFSLGSFVDPYAAGRLETLFVDKSDGLKDRYLNPLKFTESAGVAKVLIKEEKRDLTMRFGFGLREYINRDRLDPSTGNRKTKTTNDGGIELVSDFKTPLSQERIMLTSKLTVFKALYFSESDKIKGEVYEDYWKAPDVNWEAIFTAGITKYLMVNLYFQLLYDKEIDRAGRLKQVLSLGLTYKLL